MVLGYTLGAITKPMFPLATTIGWVFAARFIDRVGKGIRGAPRDALIADIVAPELRGAAYGLRQSLDSVGAFIGPLLAIVFMLWFANDIEAVLWIAVIPAFLAVALLIAAVHEPEPSALAPKSRHRLTFADARQLSSRFWRVVALGAVFTLARFSEAFLILRVAFTQGLLAKLVADTAPAALRGTAFGIFNLICGSALLLASVIAGAAWSTFGASATFAVGAGFAGCAAAGLLFYRPTSRIAEQDARG